MKKFLHKCVQCFPWKPLDHVHGFSDVRSLGTYIVSGNSMDIKVECVWKSLPAAMYNAKTWATFSNYISFLFLLWSCFSLNETGLYELLMFTQWEEDLLSTHTLHILTYLYKFSFFTTHKWRILNTFIIQKKKHTFWFTYINYLH
jgi:hypothetical protein